MPVPRVTQTIAAIALLWALLAGAQDLQIIELRYRLAEQVLPSLQPLVEPGGVLTGMESTLFVRTSPGNFEQIRQAVALLDREPRQLLISVGQGTVETVAGSSVHGSATVGSGDVQVGVNRPPASDSSASVQVRQNTQRANLQNVSSVRTIEGNEAYVAVGQLVPLTSTQVTPGYYGPLVQQSTEYRDVSTGFYATVRITGDLVTLDISPQQQRLRSTTARHGDRHGQQRVERQRPAWRMAAAGSGERIDGQQRPRPAGLGSTHHRIPVRSMGQGRRGSLSVTSLPGALPARRTPSPRGTAPVRG